MLPLSPGYRLHDRFVLTGLVGAGGMSQVWRATDEVLDRPVAVKMLTTALANDPDLRQATSREARAAARLTHPNVARIYDYGEATLPDGGQLPYLVMELVEGDTLSDRLVDGPLPWPDAARLGAETAAALAAAHQIGVVHHDVKPGNVMLTSHGAKVLDFGIAALAGAAGAGTLVGTPTYTAPQRLSHQPADPSDDVYSLGVLLHELLTGRPPMRLRDWQQAHAAHRIGIPLALPTGLPNKIRDIVTACLHPDPAQRPTARHVAAELSDAARTPDPAAALPARPPATAPLRYTRGSAAMPTTVLAAQPAGARPETTRIDHTTTAGRGRAGGLMVGGVAAVAVVIGLTLLLLGLPSSGDSPAVITGPSGTPPAGATGDTPVAPSEPDRSDHAPAVPDHAREQQVVDELTRAIDAAYQAGMLDDEAVADLRDELADMQEELAEDHPPSQRQEKVRDAARDLRDEIEDLLDDRQIAPILADQLTDLLQPLLRGNPG